MPFLCNVPMSYLKKVLGIACLFGLYNISEGFAVVKPILIGTKSKVKGLLYSGITGLAVPLGALIDLHTFGNRCAK